MKYADMQTAIERDKLAKAKGRKDTEAPILEPSSSGEGKGRGSLRVSDPKAAFRLYRNTHPANRADYLGHMMTPEGSVYSIEANVVEYDRPDGTKGKFFEGTVFGGQDLVRKMLKGAKAEGDLPPDLLTQLEEFPFDDSADLTNKTSGVP